MCTCRPVLDIRNEVGQDFNLKCWDRDRERGGRLSFVFGLRNINFQICISHIKDFNWQRKPTICRTDMGCLEF